MNQKMPHSAAGQMVGYLYQCEWALVELARAWFKDPEAQLRMEFLDDIEILHGQDPQQFVQSKHHGHPGNLAITSADLWRSVNSWCDALDHTPGCVPMLRLVTTQKVPDDSVLAKFKTGPGRDPAGALAALEAVAGDADGAKSTKDWRARFMACTAPTRAALVGAITLDDQAPRVSEVDSTLREVIGIWKSDEQGREILDELRGWWWGQSKGMLDHADPRRRQTITADELRAQIDYVLSKYTAASLPVSDLLAELTEAEATAYADRVFVEQLRWIGLGPRSLHVHIAEYHHAWAHRSMWLYRNHVCGSELDQFETQLRQEWKLIHARLADRFDRGRVGPDPEAVGEDILDATMEAVREIRLRPNVDKRWIARGTLHALADNARQEEKPLGWHPKHLELLKGSDPTEEEE